MNVTVKRLTDWSAVRDAARVTMWKLPDGTEPNGAWKRAILMSRHSPIESLVFSVFLEGIPYWVSVHLVRHKVGVTHYVSSQRDDRHENDRPRAAMPQGAPVNHLMVLNAQALIAISKKRLCKCASPETRALWEAVRDRMRDVDPDMAHVMRPECEWCGGHCLEMRGCGKFPGLSFYELKGADE